MKTSELIKVLQESLSLNGDHLVHVIFDGKIDCNPSVNVDDGIVYIEGSTGR